MKYFSNKAVNLLNIHSGLRQFSVGIFDIFTAIYLLERGIDLSVVIFVMIGSYTFRLLLRPISLKVAERIGLKKAVILGSFIFSGLFLVISQVNGADSY